MLCAAVFNGNTYNFRVAYLFFMKRNCTDFINCTFQIVKNGGNA